MMFAHKRDRTGMWLSLVLMSTGMFTPKAVQRLGMNVQSPYNRVRAWQADFIFRLLGGHDGGRPRTLSEAMVTMAVQAASAESLTLTQIAQRVEAIHGGLPCGIATLDMALKQVQPVLVEKKRNEEFAVKQATLDKLQQAARMAAVRLLFLDEAGFCCPSHVQRIWSQRGMPHAIKPDTHTRRSVLGALDFGPNKLICATHARTVKSLDVVQFIDRLLTDGTELNLIEIVWQHLKYRWQRFVTWTKKTIDAEIVGYNVRFKTRFALNLH